MLVVQRRARTDEGRTVGTDVVFVGAEQPALGSDSFEFLLCRSIGVSDVHEKSLLSNANTVELADDLVTDVTRLETRSSLS